MSGNSNCIIIGLLAAILLVLMMGQQAFLTALGWLGGCLFVIVVILVAIRGMVWAVKATVGGFRNFINGIAEDKANGRPWMWQILMLSGVIGICFAGITALTIWMLDARSFSDAVYAVPYVWVPISLLLLSHLMKAVESAPEWLPGVPRMLKAWLMLVAAPVVGPMARWRSIREARAKGQVISSVSASLSILGSFALNIFIFSLTAWIPLAILAFAIFGFVFAFRTGSDFLSGD